VFVSQSTHVYEYTGYKQKNGAVSTVSKKFVSHLTRARRTPSAAATYNSSFKLKFSEHLHAALSQWGYLECFVSGIDLFPLIIEVPQSRPETLFMFLPITAGFVHVW
jgi:hypothetical protein